MILKNMAKYNPQKIEKKWQKKWYDGSLFKAQNPSARSGQDSSKKEKFYILDEFPYPSGDGLHIGHCRPYIGLDIIARKRRMQGQNVLFPMGWDAFGLPTENYAIKKGVHPSIVTKKNTDNFRKQMKNLGLSFDWSREVNTTDPKYYKWTQWIFIKLFENGLAYKDKLAINWCPSCKIGLANEEVVAGNCERCGTKVEKREKEQWLIKITKYADRLINDLATVDYQQRIKDQQINWIGRSEGSEIDFSIVNSNEKIKVFTTRPDTLFGCTFLVLAPDHEILKKIKNKIKNWQEVEKYINQAKNKSDLERQENQKDKTGIELESIKAINPANKERLPIFVADYVMVNYGTGAIMAVPAHDQRDLEFAKKYNQKIIEVIDNKKMLLNSGEFNGMESEKGKIAITELVGGKKSVNYKLRDWVFSRQHYWGEPIPMINCTACGWQTVPEKELPVELPKVQKYQPTDTGESPLSAIEKWVNVKCPTCKGPAKRETDTMPNWAGSNWYYLAYLAADKQGNSKFEIRNSKLLSYWMPVDWYNGGMEHTTLHLLYSRFIFKFLWDIGAIPKKIGNEPYKKRTSHGIILAEGGVKMSKSKGNVINPDDVVKNYGGDALRVYEMFMGPFEQMIPWDSKGIVGARRFLEKIYNLALKFQIPNSKSQINPKLEIQNLLNKTIKKVGDDIELMKFNTAISSLMILVNGFYEKPQDITKENVKNLLILLSPFAPHLAEELWEKLGSKGLCSQQKWLKYNERLINQEKVVFMIQVNGKVRDKIEVNAGLDQSQIEGIAQKGLRITPWINGKQIKKIIFVPNKLINIVI
ncbi:MAG: Leucine-tRNA ligase [Parcubacteria group bacterium GW2011_GWA2_33_14]|nr:MAG: Leucine-tRNA ligase [Parcubacteria group bacterium GW2011_GWA2_33_14]